MSRSTIQPNLEADVVDPSVVDGFAVVYERVVDVEVRQSDDGDGDDDQQQQLGQLHHIKAKILQLGYEEEPEAVRIELSSEQDLFFHYAHTLDEAGFTEMQSRQKLMIEFPNYVNVMVRMLNMCIKQPQTHMVVLYVHSNGTARMDFVQNMEYKFVELLSVDFIQSAPSLVRQHITFRYNIMKNRVLMLQQRLHETHNMIKLKNPSLLLQIQQQHQQHTLSPHSARVSGAVSAAAASSMSPRGGGGGIGGGGGVSPRGVLRGSPASTSKSASSPMHKPHSVKSPSKRNTSNKSSSSSKKFNSKAFKRAN
eukprot:TRINITY_DN113533_c0_g1_i1.p1 TRINITY_DN113533_c0_g1~~TRINITY_DN113533_c0_g1_i1.p1  ORF type:complete len:309 (-),score=161.25 TRINITY_DN113533_c0_g1_i1:54-980(-)